ncbi:Nudix hydrolase family protein [Planococcus halocryophilus Or1]|uniref:NUDIX hydrolase n=1 Tax=Planococcus halocryophilus TaxID=1215089 RepID=A0A1C7DLX7_9BACL|nr:NUDIX hydrolase [Planococcus halocryophilus]ANU12589.1 NUDIX hydrolase [Planococcus halocryophilus]EMF46658.1 Nudix hydrolase family protein [Planococcus halocryophilus Or1]
MATNKRGNVWLGAAGLVVNSNGEWLVVKKRYGGLHGKWSLPAGFVQGNETIDQAALREVKEETGIDCEMIELIGFRSGVLQEKISDNMAIFLLKAIKEEQPVVAQLSELYSADWLSPKELANSGEASVMLVEMAYYSLEKGLTPINHVDPGKGFGYSEYKLFFRK